MTLPAECPARGQCVYSLWFDNPAAWAVPDFLEAAAGLRNGGVEEGRGDTPTGWKHDAQDAQHRAAWVTEQPRSGRRCLKTVVAENAEPTWISTRQSNIRIAGGAHYVLRAWVKAEGVKGMAGWYIHVGDAQNNMLIAPMLSAGEGTFGWKEVKTEFTAPKEADRADLGTVLRGTGTAWFDDVSLECLEGPTSKWSVQVSKPERLAGLRETGADTPWPADSAAAGWDYRFPVVVHNPTSQPAGEGLVCVDLSGPLARLNQRVDPEAARILDGTNRLESFRLGGLLLFAGRIEPLTRHTFHVYFRSGGPDGKAADAGAVHYASNPALPGGQTKAAVGPALADYARLLNHAGNLVKNPSFESGDQLPDQWSGGSPDQRPPAAQMGFAEPGLFGRRCVRTTFPTNAQPQWVGWRQDVPGPAGPDISVLRLAEEPGPCRRASASRPFPQRPRRAVSRPADGRRRPGSERHHRLDAPAGALRHAAGHRHLSVAPDHAGQRHGLARRGGGDGDHTRKTGPVGVKGRHHPGPARGLAGERRGENLPGRHPAPRSGGRSPDRRAQ